MNYHPTTLSDTERRLPERYDVGGAADYVGLSVSFMNRARLEGDGPVFLKLGRRVVYERAALDDWMASCRRRSTSGKAA